MQVVSVHADPEAAFSAIVVPYTPPSDGSWKHPGNVNIAALAGIEIHCKHLDGRLTEVIIAADAAKTPKNLPFGIDEIIDATKRCVEKIAREKGIKIAIKVDKSTKSKGDGAAGRDRHQPGGEP